MSITQILGELKIVHHVNKVRVISCLFVGCKKEATTVNRRNQYPCCNDHKKGDYCMKCGKYTINKGLYCQKCSRS